MDGFYNVAPYMRLVPPRAARWSGAEREVWLQRALLVPRTRRPLVSSPDGFLVNRDLFTPDQPAGFRLLSVPSHGGVFSKQFQLVPRGHFPKRSAKLHKGGGSSRPVGEFWGTRVAPVGYRQENRRMPRSVNSGELGWLQWVTGKKTEECQGK
ncbi:hypothetical protein NDU88_004928 [Pleurodeles waltl]|uniref:Uncharacterized protein n=1 Tax=Pleurodeles waltl TaxID=8319 RepID=A0AAV7QGC9_PLEWA|nr:hypothetical protein NDU88_004928 [Pleurodeles waltl]